MLAFVFVFVVFARLKRDEFVLVLVPAVAWLVNVF